ncbi:ricin-type beta-trefoil lectin domain protein [Kitasatospora sp. NPDC057692]|uniref:ricin-type beta-trefoil lectin domain protein n=1 Tax=Kitasatospora sp. NPDC057692 TaxID=3346215 RepID=UPI0036CEA904
MRDSRPPRRPGGLLARGLAPLCAAGLVLAAPGAAFADAPTAASESGPKTSSATTTTTPVAGDVDFDGFPDSLLPAADGSLTLVRGGSATGGPETASPASRSPRQDNWNNYLLAHRGAVIGSGDSLIAYHKTEKQLYVYVNDANTNGTAGHFTGTSVQLGTSSVCDRGIDGTWNNVSQMTAVQWGTGGTGLVTIENGHLRYYPSNTLCYIGDGVELGTDGTDWTGFTLMSPGEVNGAPTLWVRDSVTGAVTGLALPLDAAGKPATGFTPLAAPAHKPLASALKDAAGAALCADIADGATANGTAAVLGNCSDQGAAPGQAFTLGTDGLLHVLGKCLDVTGGATASGSPVNIWSCNSSPAQKWVTGPFPGTLKNPNSGKCLGAPGASEAGTRLAIGECNDGPAQRWAAPTALPALPLGLAASVFPALDASGDMTSDGYPDLIATVSDGRLLCFLGTAPEAGLPRFAVPKEVVEEKPGYNISSVHNPGRCLDNFGAPDGGSLRLYDCWNGANQKFSFPSNGTLRSGDRCVTVQGDLTSWGTAVVFADCRATSGQIWTQRVDGSLFNPAAGACLDLPGWNDANGTALVIWGCSGNANQRWTLFPNTA